MRGKPRKWKWDIGNNETGEKVVSSSWSTLWMTGALPHRDFWETVCGVPQDHLPEEPSRSIPPPAQAHWPRAACEAFPAFPTLPGCMCESGRFGVWLDHFFIDDYLLSVTRDKGALWDIGINSICESSTLRPSNLSKASPPHTITLSIRFSTYDFGRATTIQSEQWVSVGGCLVCYWEHCWQKNTSITSHWWD